MPPKPRDRESEAVEAEEAKANKRSRNLFDHALDARVVSRVRPTSATELKPSKVLKRSDCKDIHKKSTVKKSRYMTVFPGQLGDLKEGKLGSLAKLDTQNPVMYIEYPGFGRLKLQGTIVRSRSTRYFTLNVKSKDRLNLEDWFDSMIVFSEYSWVGSVDENPGETPLPFPDALKFVQHAAGDDPAGGDKGAAAAAAAAVIPVDFSFSVAAEAGARPMKTGGGAEDKEKGSRKDKGAEEGGSRKEKEPSQGEGNDSEPMVLDQTDSDLEDDANDVLAVEAASAPARPRRESAKAAKYDFSEVDDFDLEEEDDDAERNFRGRVTATVAKSAAPTAAPKRRSVGAGGEKKEAKKRKRTSVGSEKTTPEVLTISDETSDSGAFSEDELSEDAATKQSSEPEEIAPRRASGGAPSAAAKPKVSKKFVLDSDDDSDEETPETEDSDFEA